MPRCHRCGHDSVFHSVGTGNGVPVGKPYCSDRHGTKAEYGCSCQGFVPWRHGPQRSIYIVGSMRNPKILTVAKALRAAGWDVYEDWHSTGPESDAYWQAYEKARGRTYREALAGDHAQEVFVLDKRHLDRCDCAVLVLPAGKSGHLELGYVLGCGKPGYILMDGEPETYDVMHNFATKIFASVEEMTECLK
jgi:hypothetical protein